MTQLRNLLLFVLLIFVFSVNAQDEKDGKSLSKHEIGIQSEFLRNPFQPTLSYNYYWKENKILHFRTLLAFGRPLQTGSILNPDIYSLGIEFWNEHRSYIRNSEKWFWSRGLTANTGYTAYDYNSPGLLENSGNAFVIGAGYRLGIGYRFANRFNVITSINPRVNFQKISTSYGDVNRFRFQTPIQAGINCRF